MAKEQNVTPDSAETTEMQDAARRLEKFLGTKGISLKHAVALEALSQALGAKNWRTLRAKLNEVAPGVIVLEPGEPRWMVNAIYTDNNQRFSDDYHGETPLEAQIACQLERLTDAGSITEVEVSCVIDRTTGKVADQESYPEESNIVSFTDMVEKLVELAKGKLGRFEPPMGNDIAAAEEYDRNSRALEFWGIVARGKKTYKVLRDELNAMYTEYEPEYEEGSTLFTDSRGVQDDLDVVDSFRRLLGFASQGMDTSKTGDDPKKDGMFQVLQARLTLEYFEERLGQVLNDWEVEPLPTATK